MADDLEEVVRRLLPTVDGLEAILITDRDGVPVLKASTPSMPEAASRPNFLATFPISSEQASKLGLGTNQNLVCMYDNYQVVQMNYLPLVVTLLAREDANTGLLLGLRASLNSCVQQLKQAVDAP